MAMIRPETEMKDTGIEWIGNIPKFVGLLQTEICDFFDKRESI